MDSEIIKLKYGTREFVPKAKNAIRNNSNFSVIICGWRGNIILKSLPLLMHMQGKSDANSEHNMTTKYVMVTFCSLMMVLYFMMIFWMAIANNYSISVLSKNGKVVELSFLGK